MTIIPAKKATAAYFVSVALADVLGWSIHPDPEALSGDWLDSQRERIAETTDSAILSFAGDKTTCQRLRTARKLAFEFVTLMHNRPKLSTIPVEEWHVQAYRQLFDDLSALQREFRILSNTDENSAVQRATTPAATTFVETKPAGQRKRRTKPPMPRVKVEAHWREVMASGNRDLIQDYLTLAETKLAELIGCSRNTLRACEAFQNRGVALREFNRENR